MFRAAICPAAMLRIGLRADMVVPVMRLAATVIRRVSTVLSVSQKFPEPEAVSPNLTELINTDFEVVLKFPVSNPHVDFVSLARIPCRIQPRSSTFYT